VADTDHGEVRALDVGPELAKMPLDRLPRPARGDCHCLMVVAGGAARGERVPQPEAVLGRQRVGDIRERGGALVGGDDEVWVVVVVADDLGRRDDLTRGERVREIEQAAYEGAVTGDHLL